MKPVQNNYPVFEANQVLTSVHLNDVFNYLDEQERMTRANLIGIGVVCGMEIQLENTVADAAVHLARGCGVTSEGYLIVEPENVALVSYREYKLPDDLDYQPFVDKNANPKVQYPLWEMFPAGEPDTTLLNAVPTFLNDKAVLLFLELKKEGLRNCSPNNCDDKGAQVTATVRRLLIQVKDLDKIIAEASKFDREFTSTDQATSLLTRLNLPDLRLARFNVPGTGLATTNDVFAAFLAIFQTDKLASQTGSALANCYKAFSPVVSRIFPTDPFVDFMEKFGFLDNVPRAPTQVSFLQYYCDFFDDLVQAYDEFRWKGAELMCVCCPPEGLFPRHLMLGTLFPPVGIDPGVYRHQFLASPSLGGCEERVQELKTLFQRLVEMIARFTDTPLPQPSSPARIGANDPQIRITPSKLGDVPVSDKAIPYYYLQDGAPPLYRIWSPQKSRWQRANQNLGYRSNEYHPEAPAFITNALQYNLEPYNFLRIEGHLGKNYRSVLGTLLTLKKKYRIPIEVIALRTGVFDERVPVDLSKEKCRFQDLEALYMAFREEILCSLCEGVRYFYDIPLDSEVNIPFVIPVENAVIDRPDGGIPQLLLLKVCAPDFRYKDRTVGAWYEANLADLQSKPFISIDQGKVEGDELRSALRTGQALLLAGTSGLPESNFVHVLSIFLLAKLAEALPSSLGELVYADFENRYTGLVRLVRIFRTDTKTRLSDELTQFIPQEDLIDHFDQVLAVCKLEPLRAIYDEYARRIREVKQQQFLNFFLRSNPGIQHKAGVPLGGTFILVYHDEPLILLDRPLAELGAVGSFANPHAGDVNSLPDDKAGKADLSAVLTRISANQKLAIDPDIRLLLGTLTGQVPNFDFPTPSGKPSESDRIIEETVKELGLGSVIADFFLPYLCCSDCPPIQYVLPEPPLELAMQIGCTDDNGNSEVTLEPRGGTKPYTYQLDAQPFAPLTGKLLLPSGIHQLLVRDSEGIESAPQSLTIPERLLIGQETYIENVAGKTYQVSFAISGGIAPYQADGGTVTDNRFTSAPVNSGEKIKVMITDKAKCEVSKEFSHEICSLPCGGQSRRCAYRLWIQPPFKELPYQVYEPESDIILRLNGQVINMPDTKKLLQATPDRLNGDFQGTMAAIISSLNDAVDKALRGAGAGDHRLVLGYQPAATDPFGIFWAEYFVCDTFNIEFDFNFTFSKIAPAPDFSITVRYTNEPSPTGAPFNGAIFINRRLEMKRTPVPAFDCSERDQCIGSQYKKICEGPEPVPVFNVDLLQNNNVFFFGGDSQPPGEVVAWVWDFPRELPAEPFYIGSQGEANFRSGDQGRAGDMVVRLTVITQKGCFASAEKTFSQQ